MLTQGLQMSMAFEHNTVIFHKQCRLTRHLLSDHKQGSPGDGSRLHRR